MEGSAAGVAGVLPRPNTRGQAGHLRAGVTAEAAADLMWSATSPEMFELLVVRRGWSVERWADHLYNTVTGLLPPRSRS